MQARIQILAGLGNPGERYARTRHNVGFRFLDWLAAEERALWVVEKRFDALTALIDAGGHPLLLVKPQSYVNNSGVPLASLARYFRHPPEAFAVAFDEINLEPGQVKLSSEGSDGGHNGVADLLRHLGPGFVRFRIGIGHRPDRRMDLKDWVLGKPTEEEDREITGRFADLREGLFLAVKAGVTPAMNRLNIRKKAS